MRDNDLHSRILAWVRELITSLRELPRDFVTSTIVNQLVRSGTSIGANYAESQYGSSRRDFANFVRHALKSARESEYWLKVALHTVAKTKDGKILSLDAELNQIVRILCTIVLKTNPK